MIFSDIMTSLETSCSQADTAYQILKLNPALKRKNLVFDAISAFIENQKHMYFSLNNKIGNAKSKKYDKHVPGESADPALKGRNVNDSIISVSYLLSQCKPLDAEILGETFLLGSSGEILKFPVKFMQLSKKSEEVYEAMLTEFHKIAE